jgi:hypothetical protein
MSVNNLVHWTQTSPANADAYPLGRLLPLNTCITNFAKNKWHCLSSVRLMHWCDNLLKDTM